MEGPDGWSGMTVSTMSHCYMHFQRKVFLAGNERPSEAIFDLPRVRLLLLRPGNTDRGLALYRQVRKRIRESKVSNHSVGRLRKKFMLATLTGTCLLAPALLAANRYGKDNLPASPSTAQLSAELQNEIVHGGQAGFVVTDFAYALGPDAKGSTACPAGMSGGIRALVEGLSKQPDGQRREGENDQAWQRRLGRMVNTAADGRNICMNPEAAGSDPNWRMVTGSSITVDGIDLDGPGATGGKAAANSCGQKDFVGGDGRQVVDNQFYRVVGCLTGFQSTGQANGFQTEMLTGSWGIVIALNKVENLHDDTDIEVTISANADPIQLSADRKPLAFATYAVDHDPRYRAVTRGRIVNGVITIDPVDVRLHNVVNSTYSDRVLRDARLRLEVQPDGSLKGYLAGFTPVEDMYDLQFGIRTARTAKGELAPERVRIQTSVGRAGALGYSCNGAYFAMKQAADGHPDASGKCTSISTQYRIRLVPAFVVQTQTQSVNAPLVMR
jgi:hypothetical protein